jgi:hypothetical protein
MPTAVDIVTLRVEDAMRRYFDDPTPENKEAFDSARAAFWTMVGGRP